MIPHPDAAAIVLAGGRSSRMGQPKALLPFDAQPLIAHIVSTLRPLFADVIVVAAPEQSLPELRAEIVRDDVAFQGPVGGIAYGLRASRREVNFVASCDSAFLNPGLISFLVGEVAGADVVVPHWEGRFQPLHAVYRRGVLPLLEAQLQRGELRPVYLFDMVRTRAVSEAEVRRFDPDGASFFNMNTPDDYAAALQRWRDLHGRDGAGPQRRMQCTVELFGAARLLARTSEVCVDLPLGASCAEVFAAVAEKLPVLAGRVITPDGDALEPGYACNVNGLDFVRTPSARVSDGDRILILAADAGG
jgi:molybdenum cofactor guanylyltransferase